MYVLSSEKLDNALLDDTEIGKFTSIDQESLVANPTTESHFYDIAKPLLEQEVLEVDIAMFEGFTSNSEHR